MACGSGRSSQLESGESGEDEEERDDPEPHDHLRLRPALELEVVMERGHAEDATAGQLEGYDLEDDRGGLEHEDAAHDESHQLLAHYHGDDTDGGAYRQRADIAHEDLRRISVEPEKAEARARERRAENQQLAGPRDLRDLQVVREYVIAARIGENAERRRDQRGGHD